ncbi:hypothetical protein DMENIID0001_050090 [Sergentomyia squamirostris]
MDKNILPLECSTYTMPSPLRHKWLFPLVLHCLCLYMCVEQADVYAIKTTTDTAPQQLCREPWSTRKREETEKRQDDRTGSTSDGQGFPIQYPSREQLTGSTSSTNRVGMSEMELSFCTIPMV